MPSDVRFSEIARLLEAHGWTPTRTNGSHHIFTGAGREPISIPVHRGKVKHVYLRQVQKAIAKLGQDRPRS